MNMKFLIAALLLLPAISQAQVCFNGDNACSQINNEISNTLLRTDASTNSIWVRGTVTGNPPPVANSTVYKNVSGTFMTTSSTITNPGTPSETTNLVNVNVLNNLNTSGTITANVLNGNLLQLASTTLPTCNAGNTGRIALSGSKLCYCNGTSYVNIVGGVNIVTGLLSGTCP
jgi:hypothetical protein